MKQWIRSTLSILLVLVMVLSVAPFALSAEEEGGKTYTLATELKNGDQVVIYNPESGKALSEEDLSATQTSYRKGVDVTVTDNTIKTDDSLIVWDVVEVNDGYQFVNDNGETLSCTGKKLPIGSSDNVWVLSAAATENCVYISCPTVTGISGTPASIEWYAKYTEFSAHYYSEADESIYAMQLYVAANADCDTGVDLNGDSEFNIGDVTALLDYLASYKEGGEGQKAFDVNNDGEYNIQDVTWVLNKLSVYKGGHQYVEGATVAATCTEDGYTVYTCSVCEKTVKKDYVKATGHDLKTVEGKEPTCGEAGWEEYEVCTKCNYSSYKELPATGKHITGADGVCTVCGKSVSSGVTVTITRDSFGEGTSYVWSDWSEGALTGKAFVYLGRVDSMQYQKSNSWVINTEAVPGKLVSITMTTASGTNREWEVFTSDSPFATSARPVEGNGVVSAGVQEVTTEGTTWTFDENSAHPYFAIVNGTAGASYISSIEITYIPVASCEESAHTWGEWIVIKPATCAEEGTSARTCSTCYARQTATIEKPAHTTAIDYNENGHWYVCTVCGEKTTEEQAHKFVNGVCTVCGRKQGSAGLEERVLQTLDFSTKPYDTKVGSYTAEWTATQNDVTWTIYGFNNNNGGWSYIKAGRKNVESEASITSAEQTTDLTKVVVTVSAVTASKVKSMTLKVIDDENNVIGEVAVAQDQIAVGDITIELPLSTKGYSFVIAFEFESGTANGIISVDKITTYSMQ